MSANRSVAVQASQQISQYALDRHMSTNGRLIPHLAVQVFPVAPLLPDDIHKLYTQAQMLVGGGFRSTGSSQVKLETDSC